MLAPMKANLHLAALLISSSLIVSFVHAFSVHRGVQQHHHARNHCLLQSSFTPSSSSSSSLTNEKSLQDDSDGSSLSSSSSSSSPWNARFLAAKALIVPSRNKGSPEFAVARLEADYHFNNHLSLRDRGFARLLVTTVERRIGQIDKILDHCSVDTTKRNNSNNNSESKPKRSPSRVDEYVEAVLRVGAVQLLFLDTPPHAAVKETVDLLRIKESDGSSNSGGSTNNSVKSFVVVKEVPKSRIGYVNAVLRRISQEGPELLAMTSVLDNVAPWLLKEWNEAWSKEATLGIVQAAMRESPRCLSVRRQITYDDDFDDMGDILGAGEQYEKEQMQSIRKVAALFPDDCEILPQGSIRINTLPSAGSIANWPLYAKGAWWLQDVSSTLPAIALYKALSTSSKNSNGVSNLTVVDLCAAPGGKTAQLCNYGFGQVIAVEKALRRCKRLEKNLERLRFIGNATTTSTSTTTNIDDDSKSDNSAPLQHYSLVVADGTKYKPETPVAGVLLDAPCTATGTASKQPDVLRRKNDFQNLLDTQYQLARHAADNMLSVGGILVYSTCSLLKQEGEEQMKRLLARHDPRNDDAQATAAVLETVPFVPGEIPGFDAAIDANGWLRVLPSGQSDEKDNGESNALTDGSSHGLFDQVDGFFVARLRRIR